MANDSFVKLSFYDSKPGAYVEYYDRRPTNVIIIHESYEQTKSKKSSFDYILVTLFQPFDIHLGEYPLEIRRKIGIDSWLAIGVSDWEDVIEVTEEESHRFIIIGAFEENGS